MPDITLAALVTSPLVLTYFLKSNAALGFLALCVGFVLSISVVGDLKHLLSETNLSVADDTLSIILVAAPLFITLLLNRRSHGKGPLMFFQLAIALLAGGLLALAVGTQLDSTTQFDATSSSAWDKLSQSQAAIIGGGSLLSLLVLWSGGFKLGKKH